VEQLAGELSSLACAIARGLRVSVSCRNVQSSTIEVIGRSNGQPGSHHIKYALPKVGPKCNVLFLPDISTEPTLQNHIIHDVFPNLRAVAAYWLGTFKGKEHFLIIWNPSPQFFTSDSEKLAVDHIVTILSHALLNDENYKDRSRSQSSKKPEDTTSRPLPNGESNGGAASRFLIDTLVKKQRLLARKGASYVALRQWRKPIKPYQISALAALKACSDDCFEAEIAEEMSEAIKRVYGDAFSYVVAVPGGSSGQVESLSTKLAERIAKHLGAEYANVLVAAPVAKGASHPAKSTNLKPYKVNGKISGNILIVDDVATTGTHIELATNALRPLATYCTSVVWIAD
jgi:hypothetical protein